MNMIHENKTKISIEFWKFFLNFSVFIKYLAAMTFYFVFVFAFLFSHSVCVSINTFFLKVFLCI